jgi:CRISPR system Cascade subunit CasA
MQGEFNLLHEPWILVLNHEGQVEEVSLTEVFTRAPEFRRLAGEIPPQDAAVLRLLLAVLYAVFYRVDADGNPSLPTEYEEALSRWQELWELGAFPEEPLRQYFAEYEERFYLFHPERPFYQIADLDIGTEYGVAKLIGDISESGNKVRLFAGRTGKGKESLSEAEAARWLLYLLAFDDTSSKPQKSSQDEKLPSVGAGWLGKLGFVCASGFNLFETLLLNFVLCNHNDESWPDGKATWELVEPRREQRVQIVMPESPLELLTLQSRRVLLQRKKGAITGFRLLGGDFFDKENAFIEQMTLWRWRKKEEDFVPCRHDPAKFLWRDFPSLIVGKIASNDKQKQPGLISWLITLQESGILNRNRVQIETLGVKFADKDFYVDDVVNDTLDINANILAAKSEWLSLIADLLHKTEECVKQIGYLAENIAKASGNSDEGNVEGLKEAARSQLYFKLDLPFRQWLGGVDPNTSVMDEESVKWLGSAGALTRKMGRALLDSASEKAYIGVYKDGKTEAPSVAVAYNNFKNQIRKILEGVEGAKDE